ncbi:acyltransferase [Pedobacter steynii]|uniref:Acetyltransferase n=1 Tax=Pedobacter steynii TaxID=430522 RepID=A0A1D7QE27_9SPHI|nr:acyltransferase [Pedobacter steynii]AOM76917.1 acetyltransferase [Pedobacter steynii]
MGLFKQIKFWNNADRIGPDMLSTYWKLFFKKSMLKLCKRKFQYFADTAEVRPGSYIVGCSKISMGDRVVIRPGCMIHGASSNLNLSIEIQSGAMLGSGCHIYVSNHTFSNPDIPIIDQGHDDSLPVIIKKGAWLGANVVVLPGVTIGENSVIAAGAVVTKSIPDRVVAAGVPAKVIKKIENLRQL